MNDNVWLILVKKINIDCDKIDGFVIIYGIDMMEEIVYFFDLMVKCDKLVVMVGVMCLFTFMSVDGLFNLYNVVVIVVDKVFVNCGVLVVMNDIVFDGCDVIKINIIDVVIFKFVNYGFLGYIYNGKIDYQCILVCKYISDMLFDVFKLNELLKVGIVYNYVNVFDFLVKVLVDVGYDGIVSVGVGNGNLYKFVFDMLVIVVKIGIVVVCFFCVLMGVIIQDVEVDDVKYGFVVFGMLNL